ncbi:HNH endonuclease, partial [Arthrobacter sp. MYb23]
MPGPRLEARTGHDQESSQPRLRPDRKSPDGERPDSQRPEPLAALGSGLAALLEDGAALLDSARLSATAEARLLGFVEAADFAGRVEEISRSVEYLQVVAAQAVERARREAQQAGPGSSAAAPGWRTGWTDPPTGTDMALDSTAEAPSTIGAAQSTVGSSSKGGVSGEGHSVLDDGYRDAAQFLRARLRIGIGEARRRLALAADVLPQAGMTGQEIPARREILADAVGSALVPSRSATIISTGLDKVRHLTDEETITRMEHALTITAAQSDPDFVTTMTKRWIDSIDQNGPEPSEELLRQHQGAFLRKRRRYGLHHLEIFATDEQYETLTTVMNAATNPRLTTPGAAAFAGNADVNPGHGAGAGEETGTGSHLGSSGPDLDLRSRAQKLLNGLVGACSVAMTTGKLPSNGG